MHICTVNTKPNFLLIITIKLKQNMLQVLKFQLPVILKREKLNPQQFPFFFKIFMKLLLFRTKITVGPNTITGIYIRIYLKPLF